MDIQLEAFSALKEAQNNYEGLEPRAVIGIELLKIYIDGFFPKLTRKQKLLFENKASELINKYDSTIFRNVASEIERNLLNISGGGSQVLRYLSYLKKNISIDMKSVNFQFDGPRILETTKDEEHLYLDIEEFDDDEIWHYGIYATYRYNDKDPIGYYLYVCRNILDEYQRLLDLLDAHIEDEKMIWKVPDYGVTTHSSINEPDAPAKVAKPIELNEMFKPLYKVDYKLFLDALKEPPLRYVSEDNEWIGPHVDCFHYFFALQSKGVIASNVRPAAAARVFEKALKVSKDSFVKGPRATLSGAKMDLMNETIDQIISDLKLK